MSINEQALSLDPIEKIQLIDQLLQSLDLPDKELDKLWLDEADKRMEAYENGEMKAIPAEEVFSKYKH
ncbi:MAG: addiction module protein [Campylobacterota bacterium]|nr:addiction module protein [Campylobacterota bacterium]